MSTGGGGGGAAGMPAKSQPGLSFRVCVVPLREGEASSEGSTQYEVVVAPSSGSDTISARDIINEACRLADANLRSTGLVNEVRFSFCYPRPPTPGFTVVISSIDLICVDLS